MGLEQPLFQIRIEDPAEGLEAFVVVHNLGPAGSTGGVRCLPDVSVEEVQLLARSMAYKNAFFQKPLGGAKAGIVLGSDVPQARRLELAGLLGEHLSGMMRTGVYHPWTDMNFGAQEIQALYRGAGIEGTQITGGSARRAGLSTFAAVQCALRVLGKQPHESTIVIEGFGAVGSVVAERFASLGGKVVAVSSVQGALYNPAGLPVAKLVEERKVHGDACVLVEGEWQSLPKESLFDIEADVLVPCARAGVIDGRVAEKLKAAAVVPAANAPWTDEAERIMLARGMFLLPDFVVNAGGILGAVSQSTDEEQFFDTIYLEMLMRLVERAESVDTSPVIIARRYAEQNAEEIGDGFGLPASIQSRVMERLSEMKGVPFLKTRQRKAARRKLEDVLAEDFASCE